MKKFSPFNPKKINTDKVLPAFEADDSQKQAVALALAGKSFVLNGPPGTGKSHTIALLLLSALHAQKRVLFVAQKKSALEVVYDELKEISLSDLFLLYDGEEKKVLEHWKKLLSLPCSPRGEDRQIFSSFAREMARADAAHAALHEGEHSLFRSVEEYFSSSAEESLVTVDEKFFHPFRLENYERCESLLFLYASLAQGVTLKHQTLSCYGDFSVCKEELSCLGVHVSPVLSSCEQLLSCFRKSFLKGYCSFLIQENFSSFSSFAQNSLLERLRFQKREVFEQTRRAVFDEFFRRVLSLKKSSRCEKESERLSAALYQKVWKGNAFERFPYLQRLSPCVLTSVELAKGLSGHFDIVLFDESSQILKSDALPIAQKGDTVVIAGDEKQLPPTTFFSAAKGEEKENILEYALSEGLRKQHLSRHYRSKNQSLIEFSNRRFYGGELYAFPSVSRERGLTLHEIFGTYERKGKKINAKEASAVVERVTEFLTRPEYRGKTVGVVTLSAHQRDEVEKRLFSRIRKLKIPPERVQSAKLFVKNLETVQGEERDIVLLSLCFGKDEEGKLSLRFGPLNHEGGERRLNVALTRARERTEVFSSLPESFLSAKSASEGVNALKDFLLYLKGQLPAMGRQPVSPIAQDLCRRLCEAGYRAELSVGNEKFCLDLAVRQGREYKLGVILDKEQNTAEETLFFTDILKRAGWNTACLYAVDYFRSPERETEKILSLLERLGVKPVKTKEKGVKTS